MCSTGTGYKKNVVCLVTTVVVDKDDPAFSDPQKRVGKIYTKEQADELAAAKGWGVQGGGQG
jgi:carbamate kinase